MNLQHSITDLDSLVFAASRFCKCSCIILFSLLLATCSVTGSPWWREVCLPDHHREHCGECFGPARSRSAYSICIQTSTDGFLAGSRINPREGDPPRAYSGGGLLADPFGVAGTRAPGGAHPAHRAGGSHASWGGRQGALAISLSLGLAWKLSEPLQVDLELPNPL